MIYFFSFVTYAKSCDDRLLEELNNNQHFSLNIEERLFIIINFAKKDGFFKFLWYLYK